MQCLLNNLLYIFGTIILFCWIELGFADVGADIATATAAAQPATQNSTATTSTTSSTTTTTTGTTATSTNSTSSAQDVQSSVEKLFENSKYEDFAQQPESHPFKIP